MRRHSSSGRRAVRVGWLTLEAPDRAGGGGARRQHYLIEALRDTFDVHVMVASERELLLPRARRLEARVRGRARAPRFRSTAFSRRAQAELELHDIDTVVVAHIETAAVLADLMTAADRRTILDLHNVYSPFFEGLGEHSAARSWRRLEATTCSAATALSVLSEEDGEVVRPYNARMTVVPNGIAMDEWQRAGSDPGSTGLAYFGSWGHRPNQLGLDWFLREVWPSVRVQAPGTLLHLYGPGVPQTGGADGTVVHGRVARLDEALASHRAIIVPIAEGVGTRVKFIEALATGVPVVSTTLGAQGYALPAELYIRADDPGVFAAACVEALRGDDDVVAMGARAREYVGGTFGWAQVARDLAVIVESAMNEAPGVGPARHRS